MTQEEELVNRHFPRMSEQRKLVQKSPSACLHQNCFQPSDKDILKNLTKSNVYFFATAAEQLTRFISCRKSTKRIFIISGNLCKGVWVGGWAKVR